MQRSIVLDEDRRGEALVNAFDAALADRRIEALGGFRYVRSQATEVGVETHIWLGMDDGEEVRLVEDEIMASCYALVTSQYSEPISQILIQKFKAQTPALLIDRFRETPGEADGRLMLLPLAANGKITAVTRQFLQGIAIDGKPASKANAIYALALFRDGQSRQLLQSIVDSDPEDRVEAAALHALGVIPE